MRFQPLVKNGYPQPAAMRQKKGGHTERVPNSETAAKRTRSAQRLLPRTKERLTKLSQRTQPRRLRTFRGFRCSSPLAGIAALRTPNSDTEPAALSFRLAPARKPATHDTWPSRGQPRLWELQGHSIKAPPCMLDPLALEVEVSTAAGRQERALSSLKALVQLACDPQHSSRPDRG